MYLGDWCYTSIRYIIKTMAPVMMWDIQYSAASKQTVVVLDAGKMSESKDLGDWWVWWRDLGMQWFVPPVNYSLN